MYFLKYLSVTYTRSKIAYFHWPIVCNVFAIEELIFFNWPLLLMDKDGIINMQNRSCHFRLLLSWTRWTQSLTNSLCGFTTNNLA
jgi:hypothetical protein